MEHEQAIHNLKCWPEYFAAIASGQKKFEVRKNDRDYQVGDLLALHEYDPVAMAYTANIAWRVIEYVLDLSRVPYMPVVDGFVVLGFSVPKPKKLARTATDDALSLVRAERDRQMAKWGDQSGNHPFSWMSILGEEYGELCEAINETCFQTEHTKPDRGGHEAIQREAVHVAAVAVAILEAIKTWRYAQ